MNENMLEDLESSININILDNAENVSELTLETPDVILNKYSNLEKTVDELNTKIEEFRQSHKEIFDEYQAIIAELDNVLSEQSSLTAPLTESMERAGLKNISNDLFKVTFVASTIRKNFDKKTFEKDEPELYKKYITESSVKAYVKITHQ